MSRLGKVFRKCFPAIVSLALLILLVQPSFAPIQGCTPGFWKTHLASWVEFGPAEPIGAVLTAARPGDGLDSWVWPACLNNLFDDTLLEVLNYHGGPGLEGGARIFLRQAVASLLNAAHPEIHGLSVHSVITGMRSVLETCDRDQYLYNGGFYEAWNELGCPDLYRAREPRNRKR